MPTKKILPDLLIAVPFTYDRAVSRADNRKEFQSRLKKAGRAAFNTVYPDDQKRGGGVPKELTDEVMWAAYEKMRQWWQKLTPREQDAKDPNNLNVKAVEFLGEHTSGKHKGKLYSDATGRIVVRHFLQHLKFDEVPNSSAISVNPS